MIGMPVSHFQQGDGIIEGIMDEESVRVRFESGKVRVMCKENLKDEHGEPLVPRPSPPSQPKNHTRKRAFNASATIRVAEIPSPLLEFLSEAGVEIRIMAAPEHGEELARLLHYVGASVPEDFQPVDVGSLGGLTRPWAPGFVSRFKKPPAGLTPMCFREEGGGLVSTASTRFALGLIKAGFPITSWKGQAQ